MSTSTASLPSETSKPVSSEVEEVPVSDSRHDVTDAEILVPAQKIPDEAELDKKGAETMRSTVDDESFKFYEPRMIADVCKCLQNLLVISSLLGVEPEPT